jgi:hypothetical protein
MNASLKTADGLLRMEAVLHDLCQPLTILQCKLELGLMKNDQEAAKAAMTEGLRECIRLNEAVKTMRDLMGQMKREDRNHDLPGRATLTGGCLKRERVRRQCR